MGSTKPFESPQRSYRNRHPSATPLQRKKRQVPDPWGTALATYSNATGPYAPPGGPSKLADDWFQAITSRPNEKDSAPLTLLIRAAGERGNEFHRDFLGDLTGRVYDWERQQDGQVWTPRSRGDFWFDPNQPPTIRLDSGGGQHFAATTRTNDGLANLLGGMASSPEAAKDFFAGRYPGGEDASMEDRMDYLVGGPDGRTFDIPDGSDDGDGLGKALAAAIVGESTRTREGTQIANKLLANIAEFGGEPDKKVIGEWHIGPGMTDSLGEILSGYSDDVYTYLAHGTQRTGPLHLTAFENAGSDNGGEGLERWQM